MSNSKSTEKITPEVAENEFNRFVNAWDIDANIENMKVDDRDSFQEQKNRILNAIRKGFATVDEEGNVHYTLRYPFAEDTKLLFTIPKGEAYLAMDSHKENQTMHKTFGFMGKMTKKHPNFFSKMDGRDLKFCQGVTVLFLGS